MVDSTNPRIMADNIRNLEGKIKANDVVANPTGDITAELTKVEIDGVKYAIVGETTAEDVSYDNTDSGLTADDVQGAIDELKNLNTDVISVYAYASGTSPVIANGETIDITSDVFNIIDSGKYILDITLCTDTSNSSSLRTNVFCKAANQYGCILNRTSPVAAMFRIYLSDDNTKLTFNTYGTTTFYLTNVKIIKL